MVEILGLLLLALLILLLAYVIFSWIPRPPEPLLPLVRGISQLVHPLLEPVRRVTPSVQFGGVGLDLSVLVVFIVVSLVRGAVCG